MTKNPKVTAKELSDILATPIRTIEYNLSSLKKENRLKRIGKTSSGYWEVLE